MAILIKIILVNVAAYLIGSIPFGVLVAKFKGINLRKVGSGNIGATNVSRALGIYPATFVFTLDLLKGTFAVLLAKYFLEGKTPYDLSSLLILAGAISIIGHMHSVFLLFQGGRGAATGLGVLLAISPDLFLIAVILTALIIYFTRYVSLASISVSICILILMIILHKPIAYINATSIITILIISRHIPNIKRLFSGTEPKIGEKINK